MVRRPAAALLAALALWATAPPARARGAELQTRHTTVVYDDEAQLHAFNNGVRLGGLGYLLWKKRAVASAEEIAGKIDGIVEKVQSILEMAPKALHVRLALLPTRREVQAAYRERFDRSADHLAFYLPAEKTVFLSVEDVTLPVFAHELAHAVIDHYFDVPPPVKIHELLAQYVVLQISDQ
ncbi:MAG: hypothetical protein ACYDA8_17010 [Deferrisomatales bacterium]